MNKDSAGYKKLSEVDFLHTYTNIETELFVQKFMNLDSSAKMRFI